MKKEIRKRRACFLFRISFSKILRNFRKKSIEKRIFEKKNHKGSGKLTKKRRKLLFYLVEIFDLSGFCETSCI
jgi:hypothetical protein